MYDPILENTQIYHVKRMIRNNFRGCSAKMTTPKILMYKCDPPRQKGREVNIFKIAFYS